VTEEVTPTSLGCRCRAWDSTRLCRAPEAPPVLCREGGNPYDGEVAVFAISSFTSRLRHRGKAPMVLNTLRVGLFNMMGGPTTEMRIVARCRGTYARFGDVGCRGLRVTVAKWHGTVDNDDKHWMADTGRWEGTLGDSDRQWQRILDNRGKVDNRRGGIGPRSRYSIMPRWLRRRRRVHLRASGRGFEMVRPRG
jgi:hypothetical protein